MNELKKHLRIFFTSGVAFLITFFSDGIDIAVLSCSLVLATYFNSRIAFNDFRVFFQRNDKALAFDIFFIVISNLTYAYSVQWNFIIYCFALIIPLVGGLGFFIARKYMKP